MACADASTTLLATTCCRGTSTAGVIVCQASRVGSGRVVRSPQLLARGFVTADNLPAWKARVLLALALTQSDDPEVIQSMFETH
jgi:L-asparaginase